MIYFDNAATSLKKPDEVIVAITNALNSLGNANRGVNEASLTASSCIFDVRYKLARFFNAESVDRIAFTSNSTESLNLAIKGLFKKGDHIITTVLEHNSVLRPLYELEEKGVNISFVKCNEFGCIDYDDFDKLCNEKTKAIICTHGSNLTGNVIDLKKISQITKKKGSYFIVDASQTAGFFDIDVQDLNIDVLCFTGHKSLLGPQGVGGIYVKEGIEIKPLKSGGSGNKTYEKAQPKSMPDCFEAGTLNGHGIAGLGGALDYIEKVGIAHIRNIEIELMKYFYNSIKDLPCIKIFGDFRTFERCPIVTINIGNIDSGVVGDELFTKYNISVRTGAHCVPLLHKSFNTVNQGAVRFSFSHYNTKEEIDIAICGLKEICNAIANK
ncbi:MAG: aminotransferase class V-fold PLP-dependent enzyme [Lachnospirales bacterium]